MPTAHGNFTLHVYRSIVDERPHFALTKGIETPQGIIGNDAFDDAMTMLSGSAPSLPTAASGVHRQAAQDGDKRASQTDDGATGDPVSNEAAAEPGSIWTSTTFRTRLLIGGAIAGGVLLVGVIGFLLLGPSGRDEQATAQESAEEPVDPVSKTEEPTTKSDDDTIIAAARTGLSLPLAAR